MANISDVTQFAGEVANGNFSDRRLNERLLRLVTSLSEKPGLSLPKALDPAGLEGAYRFVSNQRVTPATILSGHLAATRKRAEAEETVLVAHDTTSFSYRWDGEREGLGRAQPNNDKSNQTFLAHLSLALAADGTRRPLGVAGFKTWTRNKKESHGIEYQRWEDQIRETSLALGCPEKLVHLADREADDYEMFYALKRDGHRFVMRCHHNRLLEAEAGKLKLRDFFSKIGAVAEREVPLTRRKTKRTPAENKAHAPRVARLALLSVAGATVSLKRPLSERRHPRTDPPATLDINVVHVWEAAPQEGETPVEWYLYTTDPIETPEQQLAVVDFYRTRWMIEEYNKAIKSGCSFENRQLQDYESLVNLLAIFLPIACRLLLIRSEAARAPDEPALSVVSQDELDVLRVLGRRKLSSSPTAHEVYFAIAALGGHIKYNGNPGWSSLSAGFETLQTLTAGWSAAKLQPVSDQ